MFYSALRIHDAVGRLLWSDDGVAYRPLAFRNASAHNLANLPTAGFRREQAVMASAVGGGVTASPTRVPQQGNAVETDIVSQLIAKNQFLANLAVFKTNDQMLGSLLDLAC